VGCTPTCGARILSDGISWFDTPAPEFRLYLLDLTGPALALPGHGPRILLCLDGTCDLRAASAQALSPNRGDSPQALSLSRGDFAQALSPSRGDFAQALSLSRGDSCFLSAADGLVHATGHARLVLATPGEAPPGKAPALPLLRPH